MLKLHEIEFREQDIQHLPEKIHTLLDETGDEDDLNRCWRRLLDWSDEQDDTTPDVVRAQGPYFWARKFQLIN